MSAVSKQERCGDPRADSAAGGRSRLAASGGFTGSRARPRQARFLFGEEATGGGSGVGAGSAPAVGGKARSVEVDAATYRRRSPDSSSCACPGLSRRVPLPPPSLLLSLRRLPVTTSRRLGPCLLDNCFPCSWRLLPHRRLSWGCLVRACAVAFATCNMGSAVIDRPFFFSYFLPKFGSKFERAQFGSDEIGPGAIARSCEVRKIAGTREEQQQGARGCLGLQ